MEEGKFVRVLMIDQSAAFDLCDHQILIQKLKLMGVEQKAACWLESYLNGRSQSTLVDGHLSSEVKMPPCSVVQGGIGSGILYLVYTNDLPDVIHSHPVDYKEPLVHCREDGSMVNFVDDGTAYFADKSPEVVGHKLTNHYSLIEDYMHSNKLVINSDKSHLLVLAGRGAVGARRLDVQVRAGQDVVKQSVSEKLLGGVIHNSGRWNEMIRNSKMSIVNQLTGRLNAIKKLKNADFKSKLSITTALIQSKIQYLLPLYGGAPEYLMKSVQVQQLKAARFVCGYQSYYWSTKQLLNKCGWLSVKQQEYFSTTLLAHKIVISSLPRNISADMVVPHGRNTRAAAQGVIRYGENYRGWSELTRGSFKYRARKYYSEIPVNIKTQSLPVFKSRLKKHILEQVSLR